MRRFLTLFLVLFFGTAPLNVAPLAAAPAKTMVLRTQETPIGGYLLGNPKAPLHLVEYMSFTCSHCGHFATEGVPELKTSFVAHGKVSYEVRNAVRDPFDLTAAMLARCGGAPKFFGNMEAIFAAQSDWLEKASKADLSQQPKLSPTEAIKHLAEVSGLGELMRKRGFTAAQINQCLTNKAAEAKVIAMTQDAFQTKALPGTPGFFINDVVQTPTPNWETLKVILTSATSPASTTKEVK